MFLDFGGTINQWLSSSVLTKQASLPSVEVHPQTNNNFVGAGQGTTFFLHQ